MNKLHSLAFYALVAPVITFSSVAVLAQQSAGPDVDREQERPHSDQGHTRPIPGSTYSNTAGEAGSHVAADQNTRRDQSHTQRRGYLGSVPTNGMQASHLIGAEINATGDDAVGSVTELIIDQDGQVVAVVVGVGGFLGMGKKNVAIGWDDVKRSGGDEYPKLQVDLTREDLRSAPEFEKQE
ncbi:PRC-barrel domain-containing protein [Marinimicrobium sp. C2-29]|uniref:PRC-barrel domain-containing protein n=1 Tax=Marinimicrobium sp. C2-29 TaxID=3139825 RepID=UPI003139D52A